MGIFSLNSSVSAATSSKNLNITATVKDAISLTLSTNSIAFDITPTANGVFNTRSFNATVSTTNQTGYTLYVSTTGEDSSGDSTAALEANTTGNTDKIVTLSSAVVVPESAGAYDTTNFAANRWGFSSSLFGTGVNTTFKPFSTTNQKVTPVQSGGTYAEVTSDTNIQNDTTDLTIGAKVDTNLYADTYSNIVTVTAIANAVPYTYTINYNLDGGAFSDSTTYPNPQIEIINDDRYPDIDLYDETPTKTGYDFQGYATTAGGSVVYDTGDTISMNYEDPSLDLYAIWNVHDYTITTNQSSEIATVTVSSNNPAGSNVFHYGDTITITASTPSTGYHFTGWTVTDANSNPVAVADSTALTTTFTMPASNVTINAADAANTYSVAYNGNASACGNGTISGLPTDSSTLTYGNNYTISNTEPTCSGGTGTYTFAGWKVANTGSTYAKNTPVAVSTMASTAGVTGTTGATITLYAQWTRYYTYSVTYNANTTDTVSGMPSTGSSTVSNLAASPSSPVSLTLSNATPTRANYTFLGWDTNSAATTATYAASSTYNFTSVATATGTTTPLYAIWQLNGTPVTIAKSGTGLTLSTTTLTVPEGSYREVTVTPDTGYYISGGTCTDTTAWSIKTTADASPSYGSATAPTYTTATTFRIYNNSSTTGVTCTFTGTKRQSTVNIVTSGNGVVPNNYTANVNYGGGSTTITVTPVSGYYLSAVSCPSGFTCTGYSTGSSATSAQTITLTNNTAVSAVTLTVTGAGGTSLASSFSVPNNYMQNMTSSICNAVKIGTTATLTDTRGSTAYTIARLKDGKCWMTQNLKLVGSRTLTSSDSNVSSNFTLTASASGAWCASSNSTCIDKSMVLNSGDASYGVYYNWYAATAGNGTYSMKTGSVSYDICPKGWRLPTSGSSGEFAALTSAVGGSSATNRSTNMRSTTAGYPGFVLSGSRFSTSTYNQGTDGYYWSATARSNGSAYYLTLDSSDVVPARYDYKYYGRAVRCVAK